MSTIDLSNIFALLSRWSATGCDDARKMQRPTPHSPPQSWLSRTAIGAAIDSNARTANRHRHRAGPDLITATQAAAAKSP